MLNISMLYEQLLPAENCSTEKLDRFIYLEMKI